jgi:parallel beta-helix repeat protein
MGNRKKWIIAVSVITILIASIIVIRVPSTIGSIVVPDDYSSIQTAVDHAFTGQTIFVRNGIYTEQYVTINKPLSLIGENPENTILVGINNIKYPPPYVIQISADNVKVSGFTITNGDQSGIRVETIGSIKQPSGVVITGNNIVNNTGGISDYDGDHLIIVNNNISNNSQYGIQLYSSQSIVSGNLISENGWEGLVVGTSNVTVTQNIIAKNGFQEANVNRGGLWLIAGNYYEIYSNNITDNRVFGVQFADNCSNSDVSNNNIIGNDVVVDLLNYALINSSSPYIGINNKVFGNNLENSKNALVETAFSYGNISLISGAVGNGTDIVSWDNGSVGNYWSAYNGNGTYAINQNNIDHHPLTQQVDISVNTPTITPLSTGFSFTVPLLALVVAIIMGIVSLLLYRRHRKIISRNKPNV